jgi:hypothetical protein
MICALHKKIGIFRIASLAAGPADGLETSHGVVAAQPGKTEPRPMPVFIAS